MVEMILWPLMLDEGQHRGQDYRLAVRIMCKDILDSQQKTPSRADVGECLPKHEQRW